MSASTSRAPSPDSILSLPANAKETPEPIHASFVMPVLKKSALFEIENFALRSFHSSSVAIIRDWAVMMAGKAQRRPGIRKSPRS
jgi:hypothetical protein